MSLISRFFRKHKPNTKQAQSRPIDRSISDRGNASTLTELRHQARTGDPKLSGKHHSGSF